MWRDQVANATGEIAWLGKFGNLPAIYSVSWRNSQIFPPHDHLSIFEASCFELTHSLLIYVIVHCIATAGQTLCCIDRES